MCERQRFNPGSRKDGWRQRFAYMASGRITLITPEAFRALYSHHLSELHRAEKESRTWRCSRPSTTTAFVPKHTIGSQLLTVRRDKREREAYEEIQTEEREYEENDSE